MIRTDSDLEVAFRAKTDTPVDVETLLATVHRRRIARRRRRTAAIAAGAAAVVLVAAGTLPVLLRPARAFDGAALASTPSPSAARAAFAGDCHVAALALPAGIAGLDDNVVGNIFVNDMDPAGRFILASYERDGGGFEPFVIVWDHEQPTLLPIHDQQLFARGVNGHGTVVGWADHAALDPGGPPATTGYPWVYTNGVVSTLPLPAGFTEGAALAVNDHGDIVGRAQKADGTTVAVAWSPDGAHTVRVLPAPGSANADGIAADGTIVGAVDVDLSAYGLGNPDQLVGRPYAWDPHGTGRFLTMPKGQTVGVATQARGDWAVGRATHMTSGAKPIRTGVAVRWNLRTGDLSTVDNWRDNNFLAVNAHGDVVSEGDHGATLVRDGTSFALPTPPTKHEGLAVVFPEAISDDATLVAGHFIEDLPGRPAVVWHC